MNQNRSSSALVNGPGCSASHGDAISSGVQPGYQSRNSSTGTISAMATPRCSLRTAATLRPPAAERVLAFPDRLAELAGAGQEHARVVGLVVTHDAAVGPIIEIAATTGPSSGTWTGTASEDMPISVSSTLRA